MPHDPREAVQAQPSHRTRIVTGNRATFESLGWIAMEVGIFKRLGVECTFPRLETGGPEAVAGVVRGDGNSAPGAVAMRYAPRSLPFLLSEFLSGQCRLPFGVDHLAERAPEMRERRVGNDRVHLEAGVGVEHLLLTLDDELVLHEPLHHAVAQR